MKKAYISTSIMLIASQALASSAALAQEKQQGIIDVNALSTDKEIAKASSGDMNVLLKKNVVKSSTKKNHEAVSNGYGTDKKSLNSKYYGDLVSRLKLAQVNNANMMDSTNLSSTGFQTPGSPDINYDSCHGVCHGVCYSSVGALSLEMYA